MNMLCPSQRLKDMCSNDNLGFIKLCNEITMKKKKQTFWKKKGNNWNTYQIDACAIHQTNTCYMQSEQLIVEKMYL
jgi:hypothetical protein